MINQHFHLTKERLSLTLEETCLCFLAASGLRGGGTLAGGPKRSVKLVVVPIFRLLDDDPAAACSPGPFTGSCNKQDINSVRRLFITDLQSDNLSKNYSQFRSN